MYLPSRRFDVRASHPPHFAALRPFAILFSLLLASLLGPVATAQDVSFSVGNSVMIQESTFANGCGGDFAGRWDVVCPTSADAALYISSVRAFAGGVSIVLTPEGINLGLSCDGAAYLVLLASAEYGLLPADVREYDNLLWADPYITSEVMGHSAAAATQIPGLVSHGNPIDIVFADYWTPGSQGLFWRTLDNPDHIFHPGTCTGNIV
jgi:hypothetical protein